MRNNAGRGHRLVAAFGEEFGEFTAYVFGIHIAAQPTGARTTQTGMRSPATAQLVLPTFLPTTSSSSVAKAANSWLIYQTTVDDRKRR